MAEVTLKEILDAREKRAQKQAELLSFHKVPLICFTMNIAGPVKTSPLIERSFYEGIRLLKKYLPKGSIIHEQISLAQTGCEAFFLVNEEASHIKNVCTFIEESLSLGRLFDMDVLLPDGKKLEREKPRNCLICKAPGRVCSAGRIHSVDELCKVTNKIMEDYFFSFDKEQLSTLAVKSLLDEVYTTPKPGLVDTRNNGSHTDMDITTFEKSASVLKPYFCECFSIGKNTSHLSPKETFPLLRKAGINAEEIMFEATKGVNTHKGAIYSMGILCASAGRLWKGEKPFACIDALCKESARIVSEAVKKDFQEIDKTTAGGRLYLKHGIRGIRGEVLSGFSSVLKISLPVYKSLRKNGLTGNDAGAVTLLHLIANVSDTNLYHRGGLEKAEKAMESVKALLSLSPCPTKAQIEAFDDDFIEKNLSPGGCADLLAVTYFLYSLSPQEN